MIFKKLFSKNNSAGKEIGPKDIGYFGEKKAVEFLKKHKYKILFSNIHAGNSELDIIAVKKDVLVFVEVKTRSIKKDSEKFVPRPADAVNKSKKTYLIRGANRFCKESGDIYSAFYKRFDLIEVYVDKSAGKLTCKEIKHFENAI